MSSILKVDGYINFNYFLYSIVVTTLLIKQEHFSQLSNSNDTEKLKFIYYTIKNSNNLKGKIM